MSRVRRPLQEILNDIGRQFGGDLAGREVLMLVFDNTEDREEFIETVKAAKPGMCEFKIPERTA